MPGTTPAIKSLPDTLFSCNTVTIITIDGGIKIPKLPAVATVPIA